MSDDLTDSETVNKVFSYLGLENCSVNKNDAEKHVSCKLNLCKKYDPKFYAVGTSEITSHFTKDKNVIREFVQALNTLTVYHQEIIAFASVEDLYNLIRTDPKSCMLQMDFTVFMNEYVKRYADSTVFCTLETVRVQKKVPKIILLENDMLLNTHLLEYIIHSGMNTTMYLQCLHLYLRNIADRRYKISFYDFKRVMGKRRATDVMNMMRDADSRLLKQMEIYGPICERDYHILKIYREQTGAFDYLGYDLVQELSTPSIKYKLVHDWAYDLPFFYNPILIFSSIFKKYVINPVFKTYTDCDVICDSLFKSYSTSEFTLDDIKKECHEKCIVYNQSMLTHLKEVSKNTFTVF